MRLTIRFLLIATILLVLALRVWKRPFHHCAGFYIELPAHISQSECGDFDVIVLQISKEDLLTINSEPVPRKTLAARLNDIYQFRAERLLLIRADPNLTFQDVAKTIDVAQGAVKNLYMTLITPGAEKEPCLFILRPRSRSPERSPMAN